MWGKLNNGQIYYKEEKFKVNNPVLIEGLPGIGNVGKIVVDFLIDQLKHELVYEIYSKVFRIRFC